MSEPYPWEQRRQSRGPNRFLVAALIFVPIISGSIALGIRYTMSEVSDLVNCNVVPATDLDKLVPITADNIGSIEHIGTFCTGDSADRALSILFPRGANQVVIARETPAELWDMETGEVSLLEKTEFHGALTHLPDARLAIGGASLQLWTLSPLKREFSSRDLPLSFGLDIERIPPEMRSTLGKAHKKFGNQGLAAIHPAESGLITLEKDGKIHTWDQTHTKKTTVFGDGHGTRRLVMHPEGKSYLGLTLSRATVTSIDGEKIFDLPGEPEHILDGDFSPDGKTIAFLSAPNEVVLIDAETGKERSRWTTGIGTVNRALRYAPSGDLLIIGSDSGLLRGHALDGTSLFSTRATMGYLNALAVSEDQRLLASAGMQGIVRVWGVRQE